MLFDKPYQFLSPGRGEDGLWYRLNLSATDHPVLLIRPGLMTGMMMFDSGGVFLGGQNMNMNQ